MRTDRWLIDGDCAKCRRSAYCSKECTPKTRRTKNELANLTSYMMLKSVGLITNVVNPVIEYDHSKPPRKLERTDSNGDNN